MLQTGQAYEFCGFHLNVPERLLTYDGQRIPIKDKAFDTLCVLVEQAGHLVTKQDLMSRVWPDTIVEENNLDKSISGIRHALNERHSEQKFIETVRAHGYRFTAEVRKIDLYDLKQDPNTLHASARQTEATELAILQRFSLLIRNPLMKRWIGLAVSAMLIAAFAWWWSHVNKEKASATARLRIHSLAVMPLKNLSKDEGKEYFADGMTEELITKLARISDLRVISRTSVMEYKETRKKIREIAEELKVDGILEGSVLQSEDRVRITVQLIHVQTDSHLWAESYERELKDVVILQNEVASAIATELQAKIIPEASQLRAAPQVRPQAYEAYLRGLYYADREITEENLRLAAQMFEKSVELDSTYAAAYAYLSRAQSFLFFTFDSNPERLKRSKAALDRAFELQPGFAEGHVAQGAYYYWGFRNYNRALQELALAQKQLRNDKFVLAMQGTIYRRQGKWNEALAAEKKVVELNPRHAMTMFDIGYTLSLMRRYTEAQYYFDRSIALAPDEQNAYFAGALNQILWKADNIAARKILDKAPVRNNERLVQSRFFVEFRDRNYDAALQLLTDPEADPLRKHVLAGMVYRQMGKQELARKSFQLARDQIVIKLEQNPTDHRLQGLFGISLAGLGRKEEAIREGKLAVDLLPIRKDAMWGIEPVRDLATIYVLVNEPDAAIQQLEYLLSIPSPISVPFLRIDPVWDPLRNHPRFKKMLEITHQSNTPTSTF